MEARAAIPGYRQFILKWKRYETQEGRLKLFNFFFRIGLAALLLVRCREYAHDMDYAVKRRPWFS
jgi:hypothetical protein